MSIKADGRGLPEDVVGLAILAEDERLGLYVAKRSGLVSDGRRRKSAEAGSELSRRPRWCGCESTELEAL